MRKFYIFQVCGAARLEEQLNELEEKRLNIFQVLYAIDMRERDGSIDHNYTIICFSGIP